MGPLTVSRFLRNLMVSLYCWSFQEPLVKLESVLTGATLRDLDEGYLHTLMVLVFLRGDTITFLRNWGETGFKDNRLTFKYCINLYVRKRIYGMSQISFRSLKSIQHSAALLSVALGYTSIYMRKQGLTYPKGSMSNCLAAARLGKKMAAHYYTAILLGSNLIFFLFQCFRLCQTTIARDAILTLQKTNIK